MFEQEVKKKSKITSGLLIIFGIFLMSIVVIANNSVVLQNSIENIKALRQENKI